MNSDKRGKDLKRQTLLELVDYVNNAGGQKIFNEALMPDIVKCVSVNICRALPPQTENFDPEEDEPVLEPGWPHLQVMYEFFLRFVVSAEVNAKVAKKHVDQKFCLSLVELFDSEDPRERDYLKTILHRIYGKFMTYRSLIRRYIQYTFYQFVYETERHNGPSGRAACLSRSAVAPRAHVWATRSGGQAHCCHATARISALPRAPPRATISAGRTIHNWYLVSTGILVEAP